MTTREIWCCGCGDDVSARLTSGREVYPHRRDLADRPFWKCDACGNWVGCHHRTDTPTYPLGVIPTPELKRARSHVHRLIDPLWKTGKMPRSRVYALMSEKVGRRFHAAEIRSIDEARAAYRAGIAIYQDLSSNAKEQPE